jgi:hypothetical protein
MLPYSMPGQWTDAEMKYSGRALRAVILSAVLVYACASQAAFTGFAASTANGALRNGQVGSRPDSLTRLSYESRSISWPSNVESDLLTSVAACGARIFALATPRIGTVYDIDLAAGRVVGTIGKRGAAASELKDPLGLAVDCNRSILYVIQSTNGITAYATRDAHYLRSYALPPLFVPTPGSGMILTGQMQHLYVGGLWPDRKLAFLSNPKKSFFNRSLKK